MSYFASSAMCRADAIRFKAAVILVALYAISTMATAQKMMEDMSDVRQVEFSERARLKTERSSAEQALAAQRKACYQRFIVTSCLNEARDVHREKTQDLKRQEIALNDVQRKRAAADRLTAIDQRNSPQAQSGEAQRRGKSLEAWRKRDETQAQRQRDRGAEQRVGEAAASLPSERDTLSEMAPVKPQPAVKPRETKQTKLKPELRPGQAEKTARSLVQAEQREKAAEMRRAKAVQRESKRKKPAAAGLPIIGCDKSLDCR
jgi:colicin import membrane protein